MTEQNDTMRERELKPRIMTLEPILAVQDVVATANYYRDVLDFEGVWFWGDPPSHAGASRDGLGLQFTLNPALAETAEGRSLWIHVQNVTALYTLHQERKAEIVSALEPKPWGVDEYVVRDLNGYRLRFVGHADVQEGSSKLPEEVRIEARVPTWPEMERLIYAVGWDSFTNFEIAPRILEAAFFGVVAVVAGEAIGCAFLTTDNAGFYYVRDVMVHPDWQRKQVGSALLQALVDHLRAHVPTGTLVGLYTGPNLHDFYARFGFRGPNNGLYGMTLTIR